MSNMPITPITPSTPIAAVPQAAAAGLAANQARLDVAAHNLANLSTAQFRRQEVVQQTHPHSGVQVQLRTAAASVPGVTETQVTQDLVDQHTALYHFEANLRSLRTQDSVLGALLDISA
jgi:flagellar basal body rod protein FlgC